MALSDACFVFLQAVAEAAAELGRSAYHYSNPESAFRYGSEIDALRRACIAAAEAPYDPEAGGRVLRLATAIMRHHDTIPHTEQSKQVRAQMNQLVQTLQSELGPDDEAAVPAVVEQVVNETPFFTPSRRAPPGHAPQAQ